MCSFMFILSAAVYSGTVRASIDIDHALLQQAIDSGSVSSHLQLFYQQQLDSGVRNFIPFSLMLITTSRQLLAKGDSTAATICARYAALCSPDFPAAVMNRSYVSWRENPLMIHRLVAGLVFSFKRKFYNLDDCAYFAFKQLTVLGAALMITIAGIGCISIVRNCRLFVHDIRHVLPEVLPSHASIAFVILLSILPLLLGLSCLWLFPYWLMLFWSYHNVRERALIGIAVMVFVFILPLLAVGSSYFLAIPQSDILQQIWQANYGYYTKQDIEKFELQIYRNPDDYDLLFSAGLINKREQNYTTALRYYDRLLKRNPRDYKVCTNAGNVYFAMGQWDMAVEKYKAAIASAPDRCAAAFFNLARAYQQKFLFKDAEQSLADAKRLDSSLIEIYLDIYSENYNRLLIDETIPRLALWQRGLGDFFEQGRLINSTWNMFFSGWLHLPYGTLAVLALLLFNLIFSVNDTVRIAAICTLCGRVMCPRCQRNIAADILCFQCQNFLKKQDQLSYKQKEAKKIQIHAYIRSLKSWALSFGFLFPGMAHVWKGRLVLGAMFSCIFFWLVGQAVLAMVVKGPWVDLVYDWFSYGSLSAVMAIIMWFALRYHARMVRSPDIEDNVALMSLGLGN